MKLYWAAKFREGEDKLFLEEYTRWFNSGRASGLFL